MQPCAQYRFLSAIRITPDPRFDPQNRGKGEKVAVTNGRSLLASKLTATDAKLCAEAAEPGPEGPAITVAFVMPERDVSSSKAQR